MHTTQRVPVRGSAAAAPLLALLLAAPLAAQNGPPRAMDRGSRDDVRGPVVAPPVDTAVTLERSVRIKGERVPYTVTVGYQPVWDEDGEPMATLFYTYYQRSDVQDRTDRPLFISFNGGPGSGSLWMHLGYTSPRHLIIDSEGFPIRPYGVEDNDQSILDVADIVYLNPVNTGFSRIVNGADRSRFFGVNEDVGYLADWIDTFVSRQGRWPSPKFLIGESYGTTRAAGLSLELQNAHWMYLNGVILVSPTELGLDREGPVGDALYLPNYAATAWYHHALDPSLQGRDLEDLLPEVESFTLDTYLPALARGGSLPDEQRQAIARQVGRYAGLDPDFVLSYNLAPPINAFRKELLRDQGLTVGRLDARYKGRDEMDAGESYDYDPALTAWNHAFTPAINQYLREDLGWKTDLQYWVFGPVGPWNGNGDRTGENLREAMAENPFLHLMVQSGYFDGGTDYFNAKYSMWTMDPGGRLQDRMWWRGYRSGHMMYLRDEDRATANDDIRAFIRWAMEAAVGPARYP